MTLRRPDPELGVFKRFTDPDTDFLIYVRQTSIDSIIISNHDATITKLGIRGGNPVFVKETSQEVVDILKEK